MQIIVRVVAILGTPASLALAGEGREAIGSSPFVVLFLGLGAAIILCQFIPGLMLFFSMMKGLFGKQAVEREQITALTPELGLTMPDGGRPVMKVVNKTKPVTEETKEISDGRETKS